MKDNIQIVDDNPENLRVLASMLMNQGCEVRAAINGTLALKSIRKHPPDLILLDIVMPGMTGYEVCEQLKADENTRAIPVIFLSALDNVSDKVNAFAIGGVDYITKPFQSEEVLARVETHLALRKTQAELQQKNAQLTAALSEKDALMQEILHRTKNNLAAISSLLYLQSARIENEQVVQMLKETESRVRSMGLVQEKLYRSHDFANLDLKEYLHDLAYTVFSNLQMKPGKASLSFDLESMIVAPDTAISCGLILNELLTNALKYAFPGERSGEIRIALHAMDGAKVELEVSDNGVGLPEDFDPKNTDSLGLELVFMFAEHNLGGMIAWHNEPGAAWRIVFRSTSTKKGKTRMKAGNA